MRTAIVGCGGIGRAHAAAYRQLDGVELACVVDRDQARAAALAAEFGCEALTDLADLPGDLAVASVTTDPASHATVALALLERGCAVFCEKPLGLTVAEARQLVGTAQARGLPLSVGFKMRYEPVFALARELLPRVGPLLQIATTKTQPFGTPRPRDWRPGVGAMIELSVHDFDLVSTITGRQPRRVAAATLSRRLGWPREDGFTALVEYEDSVQATLSGCYTSEGTWLGADFSLTVTGEQGYLRVLRGDRVILHTDSYQAFEPEPPGNTFVSELRDFTDAVRSGTPPPIPAAAGFAATALIEAVWLAGTEGRAVEVAALR